MSKNLHKSLLLRAYNYSLRENLFMYIYWANLSSHLRWHNMLLFGALIASRCYRWRRYTFLQWHSIAWYLWHKISLQIQTFKITLMWDLFKCFLFVRSYCCCFCHSWQERKQEEKKYKMAWKVVRWLKRKKN